MRSGVFSFLVLLFSMAASGSARPAEPPKQKPTPAEELTSATFTFQGSVKLKTALAELAKQTGNAVEDRRGDGTDPEIKLSLNKATFWQALEAIARAADARIALYQRDGKIALASGPYREIPVSFHGPFRTAVKRLAAVRDLETGAHFYVAALEVAWEPRLRPFLVETDPEGLVVEDDRGHRLKPPEGGKGQAPVGGKNAMEVDVRLPAPPRAATKLTLLQGKLGVVTPNKMLLFRFDKLAKGEKQTQDGVTITLRDVTVEEDRWTVRVALDYPPGGPDFESFQSWLVYNQIHLEKKGGGQSFPNNGGFSTVSQESHRAVLEYHFVEDGRRKLGKPADWEVVYRTPGKIVQVAVPFAFKDVLLP
jgi:hypothetical protein